MVLGGITLPATQVPLVGLLGSPVDKNTSQVHHINIDLPVYDSCLAKKAIIRLMKVSKRFRWEAAHRLPWHEEGCQHLHGHSYVMWIELNGVPDSRGMVIDFKEIKNILKPLVDAWDHSILVSEGDFELIEAIKLLRSKHYTFPFDTSSENLCIYVVDYIKQHAMEVLIAHEITSVRVRVQETETCYADLEVALTEPQVLNGKAHTVVKSAI